MSSLLLLSEFDPLAGILGWLLSVSSPPLNTLGKTRLGELLVRPEGFDFLIERDGDGNGALLVSTTDEWLSWFTFLADLGVPESEFRGRADFGLSFEALLMF